MGLDTPRPPAVPATVVRGSCLSEGDRAGLATFVRDFCLKGVLPALERRMMELSREIRAQRSGFQASRFATEGREGGREGGRKRERERGELHYEYCTTGPTK